MIVSFHCFIVSYNNYIHCRGILAYSFYSATLEAFGHELPI